MYIIRFAEPRSQRAKISKKVDFSKHIKQKTMYTLTISWLFNGTLGGKKIVSDSDDLYRKLVALRTMTAEEICEENPHPPEIEWFYETRLISLVDGILFEYITDLEKNYDHNRYVYDSY